MIKKKNDEQKKTKKRAVEREEHKKWKAQHSHYLKNFKRKNNLTIDELAALLGYSPAHTERILQGKDNALCTSLDHIRNYSKLEKFETPEFVSYIEGKPIESRATNLSSNELSMLSAFRESEDCERSSFSERYCEKNDGESVSKFSKIVQIFSILPKLSHTNLDMIIITLLDLKKNLSNIELDDKVISMKNVYNTLKKQFIK